MRCRSSLQLNSSCHAPQVYLQCQKCHCEWSEAICCKASSRTKSRDSSFYSGWSARADQIASSFHSQQWLWYVKNYCKLFLGRHIIITSWTRLICPIHRIGKIIWYHIRDLFLWASAHSYSLAWLNLRQLKIILIRHQQTVLKLFLIKWFQPVKYNLKSYRRIAWQAKIRHVI